ncbi:hypothetical protein [Streptomyces pluripotens]|uniref:hypothetical protein n=1 Tax=Streptomyces pluripotens TaxID=1355015 RepID=UPI00131A9362|nr:hypothetical protein [Streptomyces pluripotens]
MRDVMARLRAWLAGRAPGSAPDAPDLSAPVRVPDPYVWRLPALTDLPELPDLRDARWRRWAKRCRTAGRYLPFPREEACWPSPSHLPGPHRDTVDASDHVVRLYVCREPPSGP